MLSFTVVIAAVAAFAGQAFAQQTPPMGSTCVIGQEYCGYHLTNNGATRDYWFDQMVKAQPGLDDSRRYDALYVCQAGNTLSYDDYCPRLNLACQPPASGKCGSGPSDCCGAR